MTTLPEWYKDEANPSQLIDIMRQPVLVKALAVIETANTPVFRAGVSPTDLAIIHAFQAGVHHVRRTLGVLAHPPSEAQSPLAEWEGSHIIPDFLPETE
jgi:hypothetical protein